MKKDIILLTLLFLVAILTATIISFIITDLDKNLFRWHVLIFFITIISLAKVIKSIKTLK